MKKLVHYGQTGGNRKKLWNRNRHRQVKSDETTEEGRTAVNMMSNQGEKTLSIQVFKYSGSLLTKGLYCTKEIRSWSVMAKTALTKKRSLLITNLSLDTVLLYIITVHKNC